MNRLHKKCAIASTGFHLLLALILVVGPAFLSSKEKTEDLQIIDFVPSKLIDANMAGGGNPNAKPPPAAPPAVTPPVPKPTSLPPEQKAEKAREPEPKRETVKEIKPVKTDPESLETRPEKKTHKIEVSTTPVRRTTEVKKQSKPTPEPDTRAQEIQQLADQRRQFAAQVRQAATKIREGTSSTTTIEEFGPGGGGPAYANYAAWVKTKYENAWIAPDDSASDEAVAKVSVTIGNDGTVLSAHITRPSGDALVDRSVQRTLDSVTFIARFPDGAKEKQRTYIINFNLKAKRGLG